MKADSAFVTDICASPNHGERRLRTDALLLHYTGMATGEDALRRLCDPAAEVSSHYLVWEDGRIHQLVPEDRRAWHAGRAIWGGETDVNSLSIGIEMVNRGHEGGCPPYPAAQIQALIALAQDICHRHAIVRPRVLGHSDVAPGRKIDPGEYFPWADLAQAGVGQAVSPAAFEDGADLRCGDDGDNVVALQASLAGYGYGVPRNGVYDEATEAVVTAFQRHFRPMRVDGIADLSTVKTLRSLSL